MAHFSRLPRPADSTPAGLKGSGVFPVTLILVVIATVVFIAKMIFQFGAVSQRLAERAAAQQAAEERMAKLRDARSARAAGAAAE